MNASKLTPDTSRAQHQPILTLRRPETVKTIPAPDPVVNAARFWFIWQPNGYRPKKRHATLEAALAEAARLSTANHRIEFRVYEAQLVECRVTP